MLNSNQYLAKINAIGLNNDLPISKNFANYQFYEDKWNAYFNNVFIPNIGKSEILRLIIMESCPEGNFPNPNYIFDDLHNILSPTSHKYLHQTFKGFYPSVATQNLTKVDALIQLSNQNVLLIDILPSHGFKLESRPHRCNVSIDSINCCDYLKVNDRVNYIKKLNNNPIEVRTVFSMGPSVNYRQLSIIIPGSICFGSMTSRAGYPSYRLLEEFIKNGF